MIDILTPMLASLVVSGTIWGIFLYVENPKRRK